MSIYRTPLFDPTISDVQLIIAAPQAAVYVLQLLIIYRVDWAMAKEGGYCLNINSAYIWPTSANLSIENKAHRELGTDEPLDLPKLPKWFNTSSSSKLGYMFKAILSLPFYIFVPIFTPRKLRDFPSVYGFQPSATSRKQFQGRFSTSLGEYEFCYISKYLKPLR